MNAGRMMAAVGVLVAAVTPLAGADELRSSNTHAMVKVEAASTNVLIAIPWTAYASAESTPSNIPADHLVWPKNLDDGDLLMMVTKESQQLKASTVAGKYESWTLVKNDSNLADSIGHWEATTTVTGTGDTLSKNEKPIPRGLGLWLIRHNPKDDHGNWKPIYLYGQQADGSASVTISNETTTANAVMVAHPSCEALSITNITWTGVGKNDTLSLPNGTDAWDLCLWDTVSNKWYTATSTRKLVGKRYRIVTTRNYDLSIPAGHGFWYIRRTEGEMTINFGGK